MAWVLMWNPDDYDWRKEGFAASFERFTSTGSLESTWSSGWIHASGDSGPRPGGRFFQFRSVRASPGLVGAGHFLSKPDRKHGVFNGAPMARIRYDYMADIRNPKACLPRTALVLLTGDQLRYQASGMPMSADIAARLELVLGLVRAVRQPGSFACFRS